MGGTCCTCSRTEGQVSQSTLWLPYWIVNKVTAAVDKAEDTLGHPPNIVEIFVQMESDHSLPANNLYQIAAILTSLQREHIVLSDATGYRYTRRPQKDYMTYTQVFQSKFPGYKLDKKQRVMADTAKTVNFESLLTMLKSSDASLLEAARWQFDGEFRFLDGKAIEPQKNRIAFNTFPRSGNSFLRRFLEQITGITTGATVSLHTSTSLQTMGLKGEEIADDRVFIVKAHHPFLLPGVIPFTANKVICCVRNPMDVIVSYASLANTMNHTHKPDFNYDTDYAEWWDWWVGIQADNHRRYFDTMLKHSRDQKKAPLYFCRYEDLVAAPKAELEGIFKYLLDLDTLEGTNAGRRIDEVIALGAKATQTYKLKDTTGQLNQNVHRYTEAQISLIKNQIGDLLYFFGYANHPEEENPTGSFIFDEHKPEHLAQFNGFRTVNEEGLKEVLQSPRPERNYTVNTDQDTFPLFSDHVLERLQDPAKDWARKQLKI